MDFLRRIQILNRFLLHSNYSRLKSVINEIMSPDFDSFIPFVRLKWLTTFGRGNDV